MSYINLESYYRLNFAVKQFHKWSISEMENMIPFEREIYLGLLEQHIEEENLKNQQLNAQ